MWIRDRIRGNSTILPQDTGLIWILFGCAAASVWATIGSVVCPSCGHAARAFGSLPLGPVGVVFYTGLLLAGYRGRAGVVRNGILAAMGGHTALLAVLLSQRILCWPCLTTAFLAFSAAGLVLWQSKRIPTLGLFLAAIGFTGTLTAAVVISLHEAASQRVEVARALQIAQDEARFQPIEATRLRMVLFTRPDCQYCKHFKATALHDALAEFGARLDVIEKPAWEGLPSPVVIILGPTPKIFPGEPSAAELRQAIIDGLPRSDSIALPATRAGS